MSYKLDEFAKLAELAQSLLGGKEYLIGTIAQRLHKAASKYPHDQAIRSMQFVVDKRIDKEGGAVIISQKDFQDLYDQVSGLGNAAKF